MLLGQLKDTFTVCLLRILCRGLFLGKFLSINLRNSLPKLVLTLILKGGLYQSICLRLRCFSGAFDLLLLVSLALALLVVLVIGLSGALVLVFAFSLLPSLLLVTLVLEFDLFLARFSPLFWLLVPLLLLLLLLFTLVLFSLLVALLFFVFFFFLLLLTVFLKSYRNLCLCPLFTKASS